jgi:hypothetical protein
MNSIEVNFLPRNEVEFNKILHVMVLRKMAAGARNISTRYFTPIFIRLSLLHNDVSSFLSLLSYKRS